MLTLLSGCKDTQQRQANNTPPNGEYSGGGAAGANANGAVRGTGAFIQANPAAGGANTPSATSGTVRQNQYANTKANQEIAFSVSSDKLERVINDTKRGLVFAPPRTFRVIPFGSIPFTDIAGKFTEFTVEDFSVVPLYTFSNGQNTMVVSEIRLGSNLATSPFQQQAQVYETLLRQRFAPASLTTISYKKGAIPMMQYFIQESESGLFRIIFPATVPGQLFQCDYTVRRRSIDADMERIEPSLGSFVLTPRAN
jgi:hypothetical protein